MERQEPLQVGEVIRDLLSKTSLQGRMDELKAADYWKLIVGEEIARKTYKPVVRNGIMSIGVPNASLRQELHMNRSRLCELINRNFDKTVIKEIKFVS